MHALLRLGAKDEAGVPLAAKATTLLIAAEGEPLDDVLAAAERLAGAAEKPAEAYVWLGAFCTDWHGPPPDALPLSWWQGPFREGVAAIGSAAVLFQPWEEPRALTHGWCVWALHTVLAAKTKLEVCISETEGVRLQEARC